MTITFIIDALVTVIGITTPILLAASGELVVEKSGSISYTAYLGFGSFFWC